MKIFCKYLILLILFELISCSENNSENFQYFTEFHVSVAPNRSNEREYCVILDPAAIKEYNLHKLAKFRKSHPITTDSLLRETNPDFPVRRISFEIDTFDHKTLLSDCKIEFYKSIKQMQQKTAHDAKLKALTDSLDFCDRTHNTEAGLRICSKINELGKFEQHDIYKNGDIDFIIIYFNEDAMPPYKPEMKSMNFNRLKQIIGGTKKYWYDYHLFFDAPAR